MIISDLPPEMPVTEARIMCSVEAAAHYNLPPDLVFAVSVTEGGEPGMVRVNANGTKDLGFMQFNTSYLKTLKKYGITEAAVQSNSCYPFHLAAWRLKQHINEPGDEDMFTKAAYYHSRTPEYNAVYRDKLIANSRLFDFDVGMKYLALLTDDVTQKLKEIEQYNAENVLTTTAMVIIPEKGTKHD